MRVKTNAVKYAYGMSTEQRRRRRSKGINSKRTTTSVGYGASKVNFEEGWHRYKTWLLLGGYGHCVPTNHDNLFLVTLGGFCGRRLWNDG